MPASGGNRHGGARGSNDEALLERAYSEHRILLTCDKDFGEMVHRRRLPHRGVIVLRLSDERVGSKIACIERLLETPGIQIEDRFIVATEVQLRVVGLG